LIKKPLDKRATYDKEVDMGIEKKICKRCGNEWYPRTPNKPKMCPACKSRLWEIKKK